MLPDDHYGAGQIASREKVDAGFYPAGNQPRPPTSANEIAEPHRGREENQKVLLNAGCSPAGSDRCPIKTR